MMATPKAVYLRPFLEMRLVAESLSAEEGDGLFSLHGVSPFARSIGTHPHGRAGALLPSRGIAALPRAEVFGKGPGACEGGGVRHPEGAEREF
jgi:hypothetical protein